MTEYADHDRDLSADSPVAVFTAPPRRGRRRVTATIIGGALLFAPGTGTGA